MAEPVLSTDAVLSVGSALRAQPVRMEQRILAIGRKAG